MSRVVSSVASRRRRRKTLKMARGYRGGRSKLIVVARDAVHHALAYAYRDRRAKKRDFRRLWVCRINAAARMHGLSYSHFIRGLKGAGIALDRKMLAELAVKDPSAFAEITGAVKKHLAQ